MQFFGTLLVIILLIFLALFAARCIKRAIAYMRISSLKKLCGAEVRHLRAPILSFLPPRATPDTAVTVGDTVYLIRFINGVGQRTCVHFASKNYFVSFVSRAIFAGGFGGLRIILRFGGKMTSTNATSSRHVGILPDLVIPKEYISEAELYGKRLVPVLILSPAPSQLTYVTEERTSIKLAFTGDELYGQKIFTASTFITHADREARRAEAERSYIETE